MSCLFSKLTINAFYGLLGQLGGIFNNLFLSSFVTSQSRQALTNTINFIKSISLDENKEVATFGNTDSIHIVLNNVNKNMLIDYCVENNINVPENIKYNNLTLEAINHNVKITTKNQQINFECDHYFDKILYPNQKNKYVYREKPNIVSIKKVDSNNRLVQLLSKYLNVDSNTYDIGKFIKDADDNLLEFIFKNPENYLSISLSYSHTGCNSKRLASINHTYFKLYFTIMLDRQDLIKNSNIYLNLTYGIICDNFKNALNNLQFDTLKKYCKMYKSTNQIDIVKAILDKYPNYNYDGYIYVLFTKTKKYTPAYKRCVPIQYVLENPDFVVNIDICEIANEFFDNVKRFIVKQKIKPLTYENFQQNETDCVISIQSGLGVYNEYSVSFDKLKQIIKDKGQQSCILEITSNRKPY